MSDQKLLEPEALLHRQVYGLKADGSVMSVNFIPTPKDEGLLSTRRDAVVDPKASYEEHVAAGFKSLGTWSFTVADTQLNAIDDQEDEGNPKGHASVDFPPPRSPHSMSDERARCRPQVDFGLVVLARVA